MIKTSLGELFLTCALIFLLGCRAENSGASGEKARAIAQKTPAEAGVISGVVVETMDAAGYTYVNINTGKSTVWAATTKFQVARGDTVKVMQSAPMPNYHSNTLDRTFDLVHFTSKILKKGEMPAASSHAKAVETPHDNYSKGGKSNSFDKSLDYSRLVKPEGGKTIAEIFSQKEGLFGNEVALSAIIVKANYNILNTNWYHVRDGSGADGADDLTVTSKARADKGQIVNVKGVLSKDRDFGYGYSYPVIIENADLTLIEKR